MERTNERTLFPPLTCFAFRRASFVISSGRTEEGAEARGTWRTNFWGNYQQEWRGGREGGLRCNHAKTGGLLRPGPGPAPTFQRHTYTGRKSVLPSDATWRRVAHFPPPPLLLFLAELAFSLASSSVRRLRACDKEECRGSNAL